MDDYDFNELTTFAEVMRRGSLAAASKSLGLPKSTVGRRIARLESRLDIVLFKRDGRRASATKEAQALFERTSSAIDSLNAALRATQEGYTAPAGVIRITGPSDIGALCMSKAIAAFSQRHPRIRFDVDLTDRMVDLVEEGVDVAVRAGPSPASASAQSLISRKIGEIWSCIAGLPQDAARIRSVKALEKTPWILFRPGQGTQIRVETKGKGRTVNVVGRHLVCSYAAMASLIREGEGIGILPEVHVEHGGHGLARVLPAYRWYSADLSVVYPSRLLPTRVSLFIEHLSQHMAQLLAAPGDADSAKDE